MTRLKHSNPTTRIMKQWRNKCSSEYELFVQGTAQLLQYAHCRYTKPKTPTGGLDGSAVINDAMGEFLLEIGGVPLMREVADRAGTAHCSIWGDIYLYHLEDRENDENEDQ